MPRARRVDRHSFNSLVVWYLAGLQSGRAEVLVEVDGAAHCAVCVEIVASIAAVVTSGKAHSASTALHGDAARWQLRQQREGLQRSHCNPLRGCSVNIWFSRRNLLRQISATVHLWYFSFQGILGRSCLRLRDCRAVPHFLHDQEGDDCNQHNTCNNASGFCSNIAAFRGENRGGCSGNYRRCN